MKLYNSIGPNPHVVRMFIAELGLDIETIEMDLVAGENRQEEHLKRNPSGQSPTLELEDGSFLSEITAICEYLDEKQGNTDLMGKTPEERALTRMWTRRVDLQIIEPLTTGFRYSEGLELFKTRMQTIPEAADGLKSIAQEKLAWLDAEMEGKDYICGDRFSLADVMLFCFITFGATVGQSVSEENTNLTSWYDRVKERSSTAA
ncbi:glutathione S-transferase family protein [Gammaproteobacteria bacterium]|nr:glutathione S-transferase family protein [Gammaproteobacteria bacterium]